MTNMRHKSPSERTSRRQRYINAIDPLRQRYKCTAAQVASYVQGDLSQMEKRLEQTKKELDEALETHKNSVDLVVKLNDALERQKTKAADFEEQLKRAVEGNNALNERLQRQERQIQLLQEQLAESEAK